MRSLVRANCGGHDIRRRDTDLERGESDHNLLL
jgi:hypothetical protein